MGDILKSPYYTQIIGLELGNLAKVTQITIVEAGFQSQHADIRALSLDYYAILPMNLWMGHGERQSLKLIWDEVFWEASSVGLRG